MSIYCPCCGQKVSTITRRIKYLLKKNKKLTPVDLRDILKEQGFFEDYKSNPLASVHTVLRRIRK